MGRGKELVWFGEFDCPTLLIHVTAFPALDSPARGRDKRPLVAGHASAAEMPANAACVHPSRKGPTFGVRRAIMLLSEDITFRIQDASGESCGPTSAHFLQFGSGAWRGPQGSRGNPFVPKRDEGASGFVV